VAKDASSPPAPTTAAPAGAALESFSKRLAYTAPSRLGTKLVQELQDLTRADTVVLLAEELDPKGRRLIDVSADQTGAPLSPGELEEIRRTLTSEPLPRRPEEFPPEHPLLPALSRLGIAAPLCIPLRVEEDLPDAVLLLNLPDPDRVDDAEQIIAPLSPVMDLALKHVVAHVRIERQGRELESYSRDQERLIDERTAELKTANQSLAASYRDVLGLKEEAVQARHRAEQDAALLLQSSRELAEKNAELERLLYTVSHDLKGPVVTIRTFLGFLARDTAAADVEQIEQDLGFISRAADTLAQRVLAVLELSRVGRVVLPPTRVTVRELAEEALAAVAGIVTARGIQIDLSVPDLTLTGDRVVLAEIWLNLVENAVKFMGEQKAPRIRIAAEPRDGEIVFFVHDNGIGITPSFLPKVFDLFHKFDPKAEGTGAGLAIVKRIVESCRGRIWVESPGLEQGSRFCFTLPASLDEPSVDAG
jgi:signal transduction histidine kinase